LLDGRVTGEQSLDEAHQVAQVRPRHIPHIVRPTGQVRDLEHIHLAQVVLAVNDDLLESHVEEHFRRHERETLRNHYLQWEPLVLSLSSRHWKSTHTDKVVLGHFPWQRQLLHTRSEGWIFVDQVSSLFSNEVLVVPIENFGEVLL